MKASVKGTASRQVSESALAREPEAKLASRQASESEGVPAQCPRPALPESAREGARLQVEMTRVVKKSHQAKRSGIAEVG